jgi:hypothetical protein
MPKLYLALACTLILTSHVHGQSAFRRPQPRPSRPSVTRASVRTPIPMPRGKNCPAVGEAIGASTIALSLLGLPVAGIAGARADDGWRAFRWTSYAGAAWAYGVIPILLRQPRCHSTDGMAYMYTPFVALAGAIAEANTR